jgi:uncharacterized protein YbaR (Trm112 family)
MSSPFYIMPGGKFPIQGGVPVLVTEDAFDDCCCKEITCNTCDPPLLEMYMVQYFGTDPYFGVDEWWHQPHELHWWEACTWRTVPFPGSGPPWRWVDITYYEKWELFIHPDWWFGSGPINSSQAVCDFRGRWDYPVGDGQPALYAIIW